MTISASKLSLLTVIACLALAGCVTDWAQPELDIVTPRAFKTEKAPAAPVVRGDWAKSFGSAELSALVAQAQRDNLDIAAAVGRIQQADAQARIQSAGLYPIINGTADAQRNQTPGTLRTKGGGPFFTSVNNTFSFGANASYQVDFFGRYRDLSEAGRLLADATRFDRDTIALTTTAAVANDYLQVLGAQDRLAIARENIRIAERVLDAIKSRVAAGTATALDEAQQASVLAQQRANVPVLEQIAEQTKITLAVLLGRTPESVRIRGGSLDKVTAPVIRPGLPSQLLLRRPDVAAAEYNLASEKFSVEAARAQFFPQIALTGQSGLESIVLRNLLRPDALFFSFASQLTQPIFDGYNIQGQFLQAQGRYKELLEVYKKQILTAFADVENALIAVRQTTQRERLQRLAVDASRRAYQISEQRLREGTIDIVTLSTTEITLFQTQDLLSQIRLARMQSIVSLYQALGGGFAPDTLAFEVAQAKVAYEADKGLFP